MYRIVVNGEEQPGENACQTWGELLERLDGACAAEGRLVTAIRLDGVELPAFRGPEAGGQSLSRVAVVEAEAVRPRDLVVSTLDEAAAGVASLRQAAAHIGASFRGYDVSDANHELVGFAEMLGTLVSVTSTVSQIVAVSLDDLPGESAGSASSLIDGLVGYLDALIDAQQCGDWITVADIVEYDIGPALERWPLLLERLRVAAGCSVSSAIA